MAKRDEERETIRQSDKWRNVKKERERQRRKDGNGLDEKKIDEILEHEYDCMWLILGIYSKIIFF